jgi:hypothetical protein
MTEGVGVGLTPRRKPDASVGIYRTPPCFTIASSRRIFVWAIEYHWDSVGVSINNSHPETSLSLQKNSDRISDPGNGGRR